MAPETRDTFASARQLFESGRFHEAEQALRRLAVDENREAALTALVELYSETQQTSAVVDTLIELTELMPDKLKYFAYLGGYLDQLGQPEAAIRHYARLLSRNPGIASAHYNVALLYKKLKRYKEALASYEQAVQLGIEGIEEVYSNMGVLYSEMRNEKKAQEMFERAIETDSRYIPALFNLAGLHEELGRREAAAELYERILEIDPRHWDSLARLAQLRRAEESADQTIESLQAALREDQGDLLAREGLFFALGNLLDAAGRYDEAFDAYRTANELGRLRNPTYERGVAEQGVDILRAFFDAYRVNSMATDIVASPVFICGMFRSGSSLVEQMLAAHPSVTAGGELEFLSRIVTGGLSPYPAKLQEMSRSDLEQLGNEYLARLDELFPGAKHVTDKKPDNFLHLGLVRCLFPRARIIYTRRNKADNCLSIFFQQLGGQLAYATDLGDIGHYFDLQQKLMSHWQACFGDRIFTVDYDELVQSPEPVLRELLDFLGLEWDENCLDFQNARTAVKTASVLQVRQPLHTESSGRWRNYSAYLDDDLIV